MNKAKESSLKDGKKFLKEAFAMEQKVLLTRLEYAGQSIAHDATMGEVNENNFIEVLRNYLPGRYAVDSGIIIDSNGENSDQINVVIYDNLYTPTLLDQHNHRYIPVEAVYAVLEVKLKIDKGYLEYTAGKAESIRKLHRTSIPFNNGGKINTPRKLFNIVSSIIAINVDWADGFKSDTFQKIHQSFTGDRSVDWLFQGTFFLSRKIN